MSYVMKKALFLLPIVVIAVACNKSEEASTTAEPAKPSKSGESAGTGAFAAVQPILNRSCVGCHGEGGKAGIDLRTYESVMQGGRKGPIIKAGDPANSMLIQALSGAGGVDQMPKNAAPLDAAEIKQLSDWVQAGAKS